MFSKLNHNFNVKPDTKDIEHNIVWFDGEVCIISIIYFYMLSMEKHTPFIIIIFCILWLNSFW